MKKKFLKIFGVCAVICLSMFTLAGCSFDLDKEQQDKVMTVVDNADVFMDDVLDYLEKSNSKLGREESFKTMNEAFIKLSLNVGDTWSNLKMTVKDNFGKNQEICMYKTQDGNYMYHTAYIADGNGLLWDIVYYADINAYIEPEASPETMEYWRRADGEKMYYITPVHFLSQIVLNPLIAYELVEQDVLATDVLDNGNNYISLCKTTEETVKDNNQKDIIVTETLFVECEFKEGLIQKITIHNGTTSVTEGDDFTANTNDAKESNPQHISIVYEYGAVDSKEMETIYKEAKDYIASQQ